MSDLSTVYTFFMNADAHAAFLHRVESAIVETALSVRAEQAPDPMTELYRARQRWAVAALASPTATARLMLPGLAVKANDAGLISEQGQLTAHDAQIRTTVAGLVDEYSDYVPVSP